jgi:hypothetical protein
MQAHKVVLWEGRREKKEMVGWVIVKERRDKPETFQF